MKDFIELYEDGEYHLSHRELLRSFKDGVTHEALIYLIKNIITQNNFEIPNIGHMKLLFFYYFFKLGKVEFTNDYSFSFNTEAL